MSYTKNVNRSDKSRGELKASNIIKEDDQINKCDATESCAYAVTVSKKNAPTNEEDNPQCASQKSFISIHSTDQLCQVSETETPNNLQECNVEVLSLNEVFPSTSEESLSNDDDSPVQKNQKNLNKTKCPAEKTTYIPSNSKSSTVSGRCKEQVEAQTTGYSDFDIPKSTLYVIGSNPGEPKMSYPDPPKVTKKMKKLMRNLDKHKNEQSGNNSEKVKFCTRGILKDGRCAPECTGDSTIQGIEEFVTGEDITLPFTMDCGPNYNKQNDKNVKFNTQVVIIHFSGDICLGQSVETLSKEKDQQARNSELRKTFLTKYNELWSTQK